uniref:Uncharacterized protein n=1 Tax=viral metagenome TaxID=1070528 RepID=A0A6C0BG70_9ZZZZ
MGQKTSKIAHLEQEMSQIDHKNCVGSEYVITGRELRKFSNVIADDVASFLAIHFGVMDFDTSYITKCPTNEGYLLFLCKNGEIKGKQIVTVRKFIPTDIMIKYCNEFANIKPDS